MSESMIEIRDLAKAYRIHRKKGYRLLDVLGVPVPQSSYEECWALRDVNLTIPSGQRVGIIGGNGAGKSTLLKIVAGIVRPTRGTVSVRGQVQALMELGTGFHPEFTGRQNVFAALGYQGITGRRARDCFEDIVEFSELAEWIDHPLSTYSSGMYARLAFSVASAVKPEILLIDEILSAGDAYFSGKCIERMTQLTVDHGATLLMVSHDLQAVQAMCNRVIWIKHGRVFQDGQPLAVIRAYYREVQEEENRRLQARSEGQPKPRSGRHRPVVSPALGRVPEERTTFRFVLHPENHDYTEAPRIASIRLCDAGNADRVSFTIGSSDDQVRCLGEGAWESPQTIAGRMCRAVRAAPGQPPPAIDLSALLSRDRLLSGFQLVLEVLPSARCRLQVFFDRDGELVQVGEILPVERPRWHEYAFDLDIVTNLDKDFHVAEWERPRKSMISWRTPDPRIETVRFLDSTFRPVTGIQEGEDLIVEINYYSSAPVAAPVFGMSIYLLDGKPFCRAVNTLGGLPIDRIHGRGRLRFAFAPFYGGPGEYVVSASIFKRIGLVRPERSVVYDAHDRAYRFRVWKALGLVLDMGLVRMPYAVEHLSGEEEPQTIGVKGKGL